VAFATDSWGEPCLWAADTALLLWLQATPTAMLGEIETRTTAVGCNATAQFYYCMQLPKVSDEHAGAEVTRKTMRRDSNI
jgi:hypothetical protein